MRLYTVQLNDSENIAALGDFVLIREGFSWSGFLLSLFWALWHRLWLVALALFVTILALVLLIDVARLQPLGVAALFLGFAVGVGFVANDLRRWQLKRRGYVMKAVVCGDNQEAAEHRFLDSGSS